jgi:hypothetical protein
VDSLDDSGAGSANSGDLRYCITQANLSAGSTINFGVTGTIQLTKALPALSTNVTVNGPGATSLAIEGGGTSSNFSVLTIKKGVTATISGLTISGGHTTAGGGGIGNGGTMTLTYCTISNDSAASGGGIFNIGTMTVTGCTVSQVSGTFGGGVTNYIGGTAVIVACTISNNTAVNQGGGVSTYGPLKLINSTIVGNTAPSAGGIYVDSETGSTTVTNCTITGNRETGSGGGGIHAFGPTTLYNTIVCGNFGGASPSTTPNDIAGSVETSASCNNLIGSGGSGGLANGSNGNLVGIMSPGLGTVGDNGGPTQTIPLLAGSPAIDAGNNAKALDASGQPLTTDQRGPGFPRIQGARVDIGAFEFTPTTPTIIWPNPADVFYGTALDSSQLDATASVTVNGSTVIVPGTFTYSPPAGTLLNAANDQTLSVTFTPTDTTDYTTAQGAVTINVIPALLMITANAESKTYGQTLSFGSGDTQFTSSGLENGETIGSVTLAVSNDSDAATAVVGGYTITPSAATGGTFAPSNYTITYETGTLTVNAAPLTITADNQTKTYGSLFNFGGTEYTTRGLVNGDAVDAVTLTSTAAAPTAGVSGSPYAIIPSAAVGSGLSNYAITYDIGTFTVEAAPLTITADDQTKTYGSAFTFAGTEYTTSGLLNGDTVNGVTLASAGADTTADVAGSPYQIVPSDALGTGLSNYTIIYQNGSLAVNAYAFRYLIASDKQGYGTAANLAADLGTTISTGVNDENLRITYSSVGDTSTANLGSYDITGTLSNGTGQLDDYDVTLTDGTLTVDRATPVISLVREASSSNPSAFGQSVTFDVTVALSADSPITPMGTVALYDGNPSAGGSKIGSSQILSGGEARIRTTALSVSAAGHAIYAVFTPDSLQSAYINGVTSSPIKQTVNPDRTAIRLSTSANPALTGKPVTITALVSNKSLPSGAVPVGTVVFQIDGHKQGRPKALSPNGTAVLSGIKLAVGTHTVTVFYTPGNADFRSIQGNLAQGEVIKQ